MAKRAEDSGFPRQLAITMDPIHWRYLRKMKRETDIDPATNARRALHEFLLRNCPEFKAEISRDDDEETSWKLNEVHEG